MPKLKYSSVFDFVNSFSSAKLNIPKWYKDTPAVFGEPSFRPKRTTFKVCSPFLDAITSGYSVTLPVDVIFQEDVSTNTLLGTWGIADITVLSTRSNETMGQFPWPNNYEELAFSWKFPLQISIPKGYSALITHPLNRADLPFYTFSGVIDDFTLYSGELPFLLSKGFRGMIPMGTPIAQIIPFKREDWKSVEDKTLEKEARLNYLKSSSVFRGWYKNNIWKKKTYE